VSSCEGRGYLERKEGRGGEEMRGRTRRRQEAGGRRRGGVHLCRWRESEGKKMYVRILSRE